MANLISEGIPGKVTMPTVTDGTASRPFTVPKGAKLMTIHIPDLVGVATTLTLQAAAPQVDSVDTETWGAVTVFDLTDGSIQTVSGLPESSVITLPISATGSGPLRFLASAAQTGAPDVLTIYLMFGMGS